MHPSHLMVSCGYHALLNHGVAFWLELHWCKLVESPCLFFRFSVLTAVGIQGLALFFFPYGKVTAIYVSQSDSSSVTFADNDFQLSLHAAAVFVSNFAPFASSLLIMLSIGQY